MSSPSPDETYVTVANQNGKLFERILTDYATNTFIHDTGGDVEPCHAAQHPTACRAKRRC